MEKKYHWLFKPWSGVIFDTLIDRIVVYRIFQKSAWRVLNDKKKCMLEKKHFWIITFHENWTRQFSNLKIQIPVDAVFRLRKKTASHCVQKQTEYFFVVFLNYCRLVDNQWICCDAETLSERHGSPHWLSLRRGYRSVSWRYFCSLHVRNQGEILRRSHSWAAQTPGRSSSHGWVERPSRSDAEFFVWIIFKMALTPFQPRSVFDAEFLFTKISMNMCFGDEWIFLSVDPKSFESLIKIALRLWKAGKWKL